jgi:hypothetical protein
MNYSLLMKGLVDNTIAWWKDLVSEITVTMTD